MKRKLLKDRTLFDNLNKEVGRNAFRIFEGKENKIFSYAKRCSKFLVATTGNSAQWQEATLECEGFEMYGDEEAIIIKHLRPDSPHKNFPYYHSNVDVIVLIPVRNKGIIQFKIDTDKKEHVIKDKNIVSFIESNYWPRKKSGSIAELYKGCNFYTVKLKPVSERE